MISYCKFVEAQQSSQEKEPILDGNNDSHVQAIPRTKTGHTVPQKDRKEDMYLSKGRSMGMQKEVCTNKLGLLTDEARAAKANIAVASHACCVFHCGLTLFYLPGFQTHSLFAKTPSWLLWSLIPADVFSVRADLKNLILPIGHSGSCSSSSMQS